MAQGQSTAVDRKAGYHHGALREALIEAAQQLISEKGVDGFTMADACRAAGVSTAAPYRHFADRKALVEAVAARGFDSLSVRTREARDAHPDGSIASIVAMGQAYVAFVTRDPALFQLMWGAGAPERQESPMATSGHQCFGVLLQAVDAFRRAQGLEATDTLAIAVPLWTIVHGTASLVLGERFEKVAPGTDVDRLVEHTTRAYLTGLVRGNR